MAERIDLDWYLSIDEKEPEAKRRSRDGAIGRRVGAHGLSDSGAVLAYLRERSPGHESTPGRVFVHVRRTFVTVLALVGLVVGFSAVAAWLASHTGKPVNVIHMWTVVVGFQLLLLIPFVVAWWRLRRMSGVASVDHHERQRSTLLVSVLKQVLYRVAERASVFEDHPDQLKALLARLRTTYGPVMTRIVLRATQSVAVMFNIGALIALLLFTTISDPAFGWRSTLLSPEHVHTLADVIALPFKFVPDVVPGIGVIRDIQYSSLDGAELTGVGDDSLDAWAAFFPFLLLSIVVYGLVPRLITYGLCVVGEGRALGGTPWRTSRVDRLLRRLRRPVVSTTAEPGDVPEVPVADSFGDGSAGTPVLHPTHGGPITVLRWTGVRIDDDALRQTLGDRLQAQPITTTQTLGSLNLADDTAAIQHAATAHPTAAAAVVVEGWEPPVADHIDLLQTLRKSLGPSRLIYVLVAGLNDRSVPTAPTAVQLGAWRAKLGAMADPYLAIEPLVEPDTE